MPELQIVPEQSDGSTPLVANENAGPELSVRAVALGIFLAALLGAANAYLGLKAGMTVSATFPAAVIAIAAFRLPFFRGGVLEQNIVRTAATVGEPLVAAAIFTLPAFVIVNVNGQRLWSTFHYWQSALILLIGGLLGIFFIIVMRRTLTVDAKLPFPESHACYEIVRAGQGGESGAKFVFGAMGVGMLIELFKNERGLTLFRAVKELLVTLPGSLVRTPITTPAASPAILSVGYIIGTRLAALTFSGGALAWFVFVPFALLLGHYPADTRWSVAATEIWRSQIRPIAVGAMLVGSLNTLWGLRRSVASALRGAWRHQPAMHRAGTLVRRERDINMRWIPLAALFLAVPMGLLYYQWTQHIAHAVIITALMLVLAFFLSTIGGWLVGLIGSSYQPVSGLTLAALIVTGVSLLLMQVTGLAGVAVSLGVAVIICSASALSGTLIQELKIGQLIGATPWKMQVAQILSTIAVAFVVVYPIVLLHESNIATGGIGIGDKALPAPQAALMANVAAGIATGAISWSLIFIGMGFAMALILMGVTSPMVIAVGMYLPLETSFAIFCGGVLRWVLSQRVHRYNIVSPARERIENTGILLASGFIAGEAITGVVLAGVVMFFLKLAELHPSHWGYLADAPSLTMFFFHQEHLGILVRYGYWLVLPVFAILAAALIVLPLRKRR